MKLQECIGEDGVPVSFVTLMRLERVDSTTFRSLTKAYEPSARTLKASPVPRTYGGHVYAQSVWAAAQTVSAGFCISSVTGFFIVMGSVHVPFVYNVRTIRDGQSYCVRAVDVTQKEGGEICFSCICSFKLADEDVIVLQEPMDVDREFAPALGSKKPWEFMEAGKMVATWMPQVPGEESFFKPFPGLFSTKPDMRAYNDSRAPPQRRQLTYYSTIGDMPPVQDSPNLHACAHLYASDRNSLFIVPRHWNLGENFGRIASLNHTVVFHGSAAMLETSPGRGKADEARDGKWFVQESWADRLGDGRTLHHSRMYDAESRHIATTLQDGMLRLTFTSQEELDRVEGMWGVKAATKAKI